MKFVGHVKPARYIAVAVETPQRLADEAAGVFAAYGALGCELKRLPRRSVRGEKPCVRLHAYFGRVSSAKLLRIAAVLEHAGMLARREAPLEVKRITDPGWATMWQKRFMPLPIGDRLTVVPPWRRAAAERRIALVIRPGQAFGTGHHASTYGVLRLIERLFDRGRFARVLDVGTGSGILAIAARLLGARHVTALDLDPIALNNARENAELNGVAEAVRFTHVPLRSLRGRFDLITANILTSVLLQMAEPLKARLRPDGYLVLAGILAREVGEVVTTYLPELKHVATRADGGWRALLFQR